MYLEKLENIGEVLVYLRLGRFGKTLFTSMMNYYYDINAKDKFNILFKDTYVVDNPTKNKNNILRGIELFNNNYITNIEEIESYLVLRKKRLLIS